MVLSFGFQDFHSLSYTDYVAMAMQHDMFFANTVTTMCPKSVQSRFSHSVTSVNLGHAVSVTFVE